MSDLCRQTHEILDSLRVPPPQRRLEPALQEGAWLARSPIDGTPLAAVAAIDAAAMEASLGAAQAALVRWADRPARERGELLRRFARRLAAHGDALARLITIETGKILAEARSEVQEAVGACLRAAGLSCQLHGLSIASAQPGHKMLELWRPLGICGVITAFGSAVADWADSAAPALACGNGLVWKPSEKTPLCALAVHGLLAQEFAESAPDCLEISQLWLGAREQGEYLAQHPGVRLVSASGSSCAGRAIASRCAPTFKRVLLELGGSSAAIVCASAPLEQTTRALVFSAIGTAGQHRLALRRVFVHASVHDELVGRLKAAYRELRIGHPFEQGISLGPLIDGAALDAMQSMLADCAARGNRITGGERLMAQLLPQACYVRPALVETDGQHETMLSEVSAPILFLQRFTALDEAIALSNAAPRGLASCIFTESLREAERFLSPAGSDCEIANLNLGTRGAQEADAAKGMRSGREAGPEVWKNFMRRATSTISADRALPPTPDLRFGP